MSSRISDNFLLDFSKHGPQVDYVAFSGVWSSYGVTSVQELESALPSTICENEPRRWRSCMPKGLQANLLPLQPLENIDGIVRAD